MEMQRVLIDRNMYKVSDKGEPGGRVHCRLIFLTLLCCCLTGKAHGARRISQVDRNAESQETSSTSSSAEEGRHLGLVSSIVVVLRSFIEQVNERMLFNYSVHRSVKRINCKCKNQRSLA